MGKTWPVVGLIVLSFAYANARPLPPPPPNVDVVKTCEAKCKAAANAIACGDALLYGRAIEPDRACAATMYHAACSRLDASGCLKAAGLAKTGWLFEVEREPGKYESFIFRAQELAAMRCRDDDASGCAVAARAAREQSGSDQDLAGRHAERGCKANDLESCEVLADIAIRANDDEAKRRKVLARDGMKTAAEKRCKERGDRAACFTAKYRSLVDPSTDLDTAKAIGNELVTMCREREHDLCSRFAYQLILQRPAFGLAPDPQTGIAIGTRQCELGDRNGCWLLVRAYSDQKNEAKAREVAQRTCRISTPEFVCEECRRYPDLPECELRRLFAKHDQCGTGDARTCRILATEIEKGTPPELPASLRDGCADDARACRTLVAARYMRRGCDGGDRRACDDLAMLCKGGGVPAELCHQALIHTDLFYVAESQLYTGGKPTLVVEGTVSAQRVDTVALAAAANAGFDFQMRRGKLDADLVVDIVLDRARRAAIELVVGELERAGAAARFGYLADLFAQGTALLADPSTLRREKFQDLAMTVVRAFVAANLIDGKFPTANAVVSANFGLAFGQLGLEQGKPMPAALRSYLVDQAYRALGAEPLFRRAGGRDGVARRCPWSSGDGKQLCERFDKLDASAVFGVKFVLDGLGLAKALRDAGFDKLRPLIEAVTRSQLIADLSKTQGLNLKVWSQFVVTSRDLFIGQRERLAALRQLVRPSTYQANGAELAVLAAYAVDARTALDNRTIRQLFGADNVGRVMRIVVKIEQAVKAPSEAPPENLVGILMTDVDRGGQLSKLREEIGTEIKKWGNKDEIEQRIATIEASIGQLGTAVDELETSIGGIRRLFRGFSDQDKDDATSFDLGKLPLYALDDLSTRLQRAAHAWYTIEVELHRLVPGQFDEQLRAARSATARMLAFLDLMSRAARSTRVSKTCGEVVDALRALGSLRDDKFSAPLYDVLEPALGAIRSHEPMSLELLFAVIARVRLDPLLGSLQSTDRACSTKVECWTVKLVHALQESVEREGDQIRIDGGKFAQRLARAGDDFRREHTWRGYLHLTVGVGGLYSDPVGDAEDARRSVPLISEQVGFGIASPTFWRNRVTFKVGAAASGLLYRAVLDSEESNAIMVHPALLAFDVGDLIEVYVSPAMLLLYPPEGTRDTSLRWAFGAGLSVPLGSYLERLR